MKPTDRDRTPQAGGCSQACHLQLEAGLHYGTKTLRSKGGGHARPKQFKWLHKSDKRQRLILGMWMHEVYRELYADNATVVAGRGILNELGSANAPGDLKMWLQRTERIRTHQLNTEHQLYAVPARKIECSSKGTQAHHATLA